MCQKNESEICRHSLFVVHAYANVLFKICANNYYSSLRHIMQTKIMSYLINLRSKHGQHYESWSTLHRKWFTNVHIIAWLRHWRHWKGCILHRQCSWCTMKTLFYLHFLIIYSRHGFVVHLESIITHLMFNSMQYEHKNESFVIQWSFSLIGCGNTCFDLHK